MILTAHPDVAPRPLTRANRGFRRWFYDRWGKENTVVIGSAADVDFAPFRQELSIKRCWNGAETFLLDSRQLAVDDDHYLVLNAGSVYGAAVHSPAVATSMSVFFRPAMGEEVAAAARQSTQELLDRETDVVRTPVNFAEHVRPLDKTVEAILLDIKRVVEAGQRDEQWLEERLLHLLRAMLWAEQGWRTRGTRLSDVSRSAHMELLSRIDRAADLIMSCHTESITLDDVAHAARLSKFHLVRVFQMVHGLTPMTLLQKLRTRTAARLIQTTELSLDEVVALSGFGSRQTMFRHLRHQCGFGGRALVP